MGNLGGDGHTVGKILRRMTIEMIAPFIATPVLQQIFQRHTAQVLCCLIAIVGYEVVFRFQLITDGGADGFLPQAGCVSTHLPGALQGNDTFVEQADQGHGAIAGHQCLQILQPAG